MGRARVKGKERVEQVLLHLPQPVLLHLPQPIFQPRCQLDVQNQKTAAKVVKRAARVPASQATGGKEKAKEGAKEGAKEEAKEEAKERGKELKMRSHHKRKRKQSQQLILFTFTGETITNQIFFIIESIFELHIFLWGREHAIQSKND